jgi:type IV secretion system protein TrbI
MDGSRPPTIQDHRERPPGVLPKNLQAWVMGGIALVMTIIIAFSGRTAPKPPTPPPVPGVDATDPNAARIQEYRARIEEDVQRLAREQARSDASLVTTGAGAGRERTAPGASSNGGGWSSGGGGRPERSAIEEDRERRRYESRFASSIAFTKRQTSLTAQAASPLSALGLSTNDGSRQTKAPTVPTHTLLEGTVIETVLTNRLDGTFSGPVDCMVTTPVFSSDRRREVIPSGTRVLGSVRPVDSFGQQRLALSFHRMILPDKTSVSLESLPALNQVGETGLIDLVNRRYAQLFGVSLAIGAIAGLAQVNTAAGATATGGDIYRQGVASSLSQSSLNILDRFLNVLPTFTVREGHRIKVYLTSDLEVPVRPDSASPKRTGGRS